MDFSRYCWGSEDLSMLKPSNACQLVCPLFWAGSPKPLIYLMEKELQGGREHFELVDWNNGRQPSSATWQIVSRTGCRVLKEGAMDGWLHPWRKHVPATMRCTGQPEAKAFPQGLGTNFKANAGWSLILSCTPKSWLPSLRAPVHSTHYILSLALLQNLTIPPHFSHPKVRF